MFGENIKKIRESKNIGVNELSRLSGVNASYISALERDEKKNPSVMILNKLANALGIAVDDIMKSESNIDEESSNIHEESITYETDEFKTAEAAMKFILKQPAIMGFGGFDANKLSDEEIVQFANELLSQLQLLGLKYKK
ncbi:helix-turn-helix domain-containing protein [Clostridium beijerinckii]|uniref:helix-turn-helix domain-containing protein n=1 Tax=Clostridium beijerinckii TaxID=1520 RepID=UPI00098C25E9|nr:helix-turn-helix transcriptional regulator [Clostridium beijerinckii]MBA8935567.1 transcriptional regulator with XRE-family HTH domain [Clostridium beijerinckii]NRU39962.1 transcriptional regulator with XRE-family HTH domain [Clostridium beijerinckii]NSA96759.1 transcriptional regulator with XRE-family HTH domain [Clostridium beijerinckii]OOM61309.1 HTH-type transcriptional repressor RghR [Clostridium beijerinckii]OOM71803.1 HTH-type transcriptional repressor RghR [Clostridium beijerinckii]